MTYSRYRTRQKTKNDSDLYDDLLQKKGLDYINQYESPVNMLDKTKSEFPYTEYVWKPGDKLYKLAQLYYNDSKLWWIIAHINLKPTDSDYQPGDTVIIPSKSSLNQILQLLGY